MPLRAAADHRKNLLRFLIAGLFNTITTFLLYLALMSHLSYKLSYTLAFVTGIILSYVLNRLFVFRAHKGSKSLIAMPLIYLVQYILGMLVILAWVELLFMNPTWGPLVSIAATVPITYILSHHFFAGGNSRS